jgi:hypothetical protein
MNSCPRRASAAGRSGVRGQLMERDVDALWYRVPRLTLPIPGVREFQERYESAVPDLPLAAVCHQPPFYTEGSTSVRSPRSGSKLRVFVRISTCWAVACSRGVREATLPRDLLLAVEPESPCKLGEPTPGLEWGTPSLRVLTRCPLQSSQGAVWRIVEPKTADLGFPEVTGDDSVVDSWWTPRMLAG